MWRLSTVVAAFGWTFSAVLLWARANAEEQHVDFSVIDVNRLAENVHGTEILLLDNRYREHAGYRFEDFFWTGSGDEPIGDNPWNVEHPETVYETKTIIQTVFIESSHTSHNESSINSANCTKKDCITTPPPQVPDGDISPSKTLPPPSNNDTGNGDTEAVEDDDLFGADRQFWLLTILRSDGKDPVIVDLKNSLAKLYKKAFERQQAKHLGIINRGKREFIEENAEFIDAGVRGKREVVDKPISVHIHKLNKTRLNGDQKIQVLYHVSVDGKPVPAVTAAGDMRYVTDEEVRDALGYPFIVKAEPYLKPAEPQSLSSAKNTWVFIGVTIIAFLVFLLVIAFLLLGIKKRKRVATPTTSLGVENRQHIFERAVGRDNKAYTEGLDDSRAGESPTYIKYKNETSTMTRSAIDSPNRPMSVTSSSSSSSTSLDISPILNLKKTPHKKTLRPLAAYNKTSPIFLTQIPQEIFDSDSSSSRKDSPDTVFIGNYDPGVMSPKSYLSMPSVKAFPRENMPEPLNKVLEPVSILHLDMPEDDAVYADSMRTRHVSKLARHGSVGAVEDPGVIGPIVWNMHCQRLQHGVSVDEGIGDVKGENVSKMRKRFHDLLDDTFSLFGSRRESPSGFEIHPGSRRIPVDLKSHSAANTRSSDDLKAPTPKPRPKTSCPRKEDLHPRSPKGAWSSKAPSPLVRPLSAGIINPTPRINKDHILAEGRFRSDDPAVPLISAIKSELERVSLPGSTNDLKD